jgi:ketosteroid isomerase-like protein
MSSESTTIGGVQAVVDAYFDGINEERYDDVGRLFAPDGVLMAPGIKPLRGPEQISAYFGKALAPYPVHYDGPTRHVVAGNTVTTEIAFTGTLANGAPMAFEAVDVFDLDDEGRIVKLTTWYDSHLVRGRLAEAQALNAAPEAERARLGSLAEVTPARTRRALREVRQGTPVALGTAARWRALPAGAGPFAARTLLVDAADATAATPAPGDVLLVRTGGADLALDGLPLAGLAAVATDGRVAGDAGDLAVGEGWDLDAVHAAARRPIGLLVSVPAGDAVNGAIWL